MSQKEIEHSLTLLAENWEIDLLISDFALGKRNDIADVKLKVDKVIFHIPYVSDEKKYVLWKCYWPDCNNCCNRQGRLPLTSDDLIQISKQKKYDTVSEFVKKETVSASWQEPSPSGGHITMTTINLKRKADETEADDGTHVSCRYLDSKGYCGIHPNRPGVCYLYPFSTWLENEKGLARVHATFQLTGDCPGFYVSDNLEDMKSELQDYSKIIYDYNMKFNRTIREGLACVNF